MKQGCKNCGNFMPSGWGDEVPTRWNAQGSAYIPDFLGLSRTGFLMRSAGKCNVGNNLRDENGAEYIPPEEAAEMFEPGTGCEDWIPRKSYDVDTAPVIGAAERDRCPYERAMRAHVENLKRLVENLGKKAKEDSDADPTL